MSLNYFIFAFFFSPFFVSRFLFVFPLFYSGFLSKDGALNNVLGFTKPASDIRVSVGVNQFIHDPGSCLYVLMVMKVEHSSASSTIRTTFRCPTRVSISASLSLSLDGCFLYLIFVAVITFFLEKVTTLSTLNSGIVLLYCFDGCLSSADRHFPWLGLICKDGWNGPFAETPVWHLL